MSLRRAAIPRINPDIEPALTISVKNTARWKYHYRVNQIYPPTVFKQAGQYGTQITC
jgi:hypothetical protein